MKLLKISNTKISTCPLILGVVLFLSMTHHMHAEIMNFKYVISDHLGTAKMLIDEEGNVIWPIIGTVESNELLPFGGELDVYQSEARYNLNFTNKELDRVLDLHYFGARYYQANIGRFLSPDPVAGNPEEPLSWNKYLYCRNNPIMFIDPTGMATTAPKPDDSNGFEFVGPPDPQIQQDESTIADQITNKIIDSLDAGLSADNLRSMTEAGILSGSKVVDIITKATKGTGNFGIGTATETEAMHAGKLWVGEDFRVASDGKTMVSKNSLRQFRPPSFKQKLDKTQANFESRLIPKGPWIQNGHLDIVP